MPVPLRRTLEIRSGKDLFMVGFVSSQTRRDLGEKHYNAIVTKISFQSKICRTLNTIHRQLQMESLEEES